MLHLRRPAATAPGWTPKTGGCAAAPSAANLGGAAPYWFTDTFDVVGNRTKRVARTASTTSTSTYTYPGAGQTGAHRVTSVTTTGSGAGTSSFGYDAAGNTTSRAVAGKAAQALTWDAEGELATLKAGSATDAYVYTAGGDRLVRRQGGSTTVYLPGGQELTLTAGTVKATRYYSFNGSTVAVRTAAGGSGVTALVSDGQNTAQLAFHSSTKQVTRRYTDPYGNPRGTTPTTWPGDRGFLDKTTDTTGLPQVGARYYDPVIGRFISVDPIMDLTDPQQWHGYAYANNNPITYTDPTGLKPHVAHDGTPGGRGPSRPNVVDVVKTAVQTTVSLASHYAGGAVAGSKSLLQGMVGSLPIVQAYNVARNPQAYWDAHVTTPLNAWRGARNYADFQAIIGGELYRAYVEPVGTWWNDADNINDRASKFGTVGFYAVTMVLPVRAVPRGTMPAATLSRPAAAKSLTPLEQGAAKVPGSWGPGLANKKGFGTRWTDPASQGNGVRIDEGVPGSPWPSQQVDHVVVRSGGQVLGPDGKPIVGSLSENPQAHIPLSDWLKWSDWNDPG